ncbi:unnamed protein product [Trifolium pratense]|uniref:Uncharacterized protein n=1 Tax=Trifolium pratense TaxID=57577 RepID=A0ACB0I7L4_TRIPR|nr:unnamed protein product [Trifolium pratense]
MLLNEKIILEKKKNCTFNFLHFSSSPKTSSHSLVGNTIFPFSFIAYPIALLPSPRLKRSKNQHLFGKILINPQHRGSHVLSAGMVPYQVSYSLICFCVYHLISIAKQ